MNGLGQLDQAFQSVKEFADQFSGSQEIRMMLVELLRAASREEEALEQLAKIAGDLEMSGPARPTELTGDAQTTSAVAPAPRPKIPGRGDLVFLDTGLQVPTAAPAAPPEQHPVVEAPPPDGLELTEAGYGSGGEPASAESSAPVAGLEQTVEADLEIDPVGSIAGLELEASADDVAFEGVPLESMDSPVPTDSEPVEG